MITTEHYDSLAYRTMCVMDIMMGIDSEYRGRFDSSEDMFNNLTTLLFDFENQDNINYKDFLGDGSWYDSLVEFLKQENK